MSTLLLVRAVGPGLTPLGVSATLPTPSLQITDARGAIVPQANMPLALPTVADATGRVGAFALPNNSADIARLYYRRRRIHRARLIRRCRHGCRARRNLRGAVSD